MIRSTLVTRRSSRAGCTDTPGACSAKIVVRPETTCKRGDDQRVDAARRDVSVQLVPVDRAANHDLDRARVEQRVAEAHSRRDALEPRFSGPRPEPEGAHARVIRQLQALPRRGQAGDAVVRLVASSTPDSSR